MKISVIQYFVFIVLQNSRIALPIALQVMRQQPTVLPVIYYKRRLASAPVSICHSANFNFLAIPLLQASDTTSSFLNSHNCIFYTTQFQILYLDPPVCRDPDYETYFLRLYFCNRSLKGYRVR